MPLCCRLLESDHGRKTTVQEHTRKVVWGIACPHLALLHLGVALASELPVDDAPVRLDVVWAAVLVLQIVSVLPDIEANDWSSLSARNLLAHQWRVLVRGRHDLERAVLLVH